MDRIEGLLREAHKAGADLVSLPETAHLMELDRERVLAVAKSEDTDPGLARLKTLAAELALWVHAGSLIIKRPDGRLANRAFVIGPDGRVAARYDKIHMFDVTLASGEAYRESALYTPGTELVTVAAAGQTLGLSICYDLRFPHLYRRLAQAGASLLMVPAAFTVPTGEAHWHTLLRARAIETGCFVVAAAQTGHHETGRRTFGHSLVVDPWGTVVLDAGIEPGLSIVDIDPARVKDARSRIPSLGLDAPLDGP